MSYAAITAGEIAVKQPLKQSLMQKIKDNFDAINSSVNSISGVELPNGDFEIDGDSDGIPDLWTVSTYAGGSASLDTADPASGARCLKFVHPGGAGNGGGYADSDYIPCRQLGGITLWLKATAACKNRVVARFYTREKIYLSEQVLDERTTNPSSWTLMIGSFSHAVSDARFVKIRLIGGYTDTNVAASIYFDNVRVYQVMPASFRVPFSFSSRSFSNGSFDDQASAMVYLPVIMSGMIAQAEGGIRIAVNVDAYHSTGLYPVFLRLRLGSVYGPQSSTDETSWTNLLLTLTYAGDQPVYGAGVLLYIQGYRSVSGTGYVRKLSAYAALEILGY